jgi:hypothetical protein
MYLVKQPLHCIVAVRNIPVEPDTSSPQDKVMDNGHVGLKRLPMVIAISLQLGSGDNAGWQCHHQGSFKNFQGEH